jgi:hypothetical protein
MADDLQIREQQPVTNDNVLVAGALTLTSEEEKAPNPQPNGLGGNPTKGKKRGAEDGEIEGEGEPLENGEADDDSVNEGPPATSETPSIWQRLTGWLFKNRKEGENSDDPTQKRAAQIRSLKRLILTKQLSTNDLHLLDESKEILDFMKKVSELTDDELDMLKSLLRQKLYSQSPIGNPIKLVQNGLGAVVGKVVFNPLADQKIRSDVQVTGALDELMGDYVDDVNPIVKLTIAVTSDVISANNEQQMQFLNFKHSLTPVINPNQPVALPPPTLPVPLVVGSGAPINHGESITGKLVTPSVSAPITITTTTATAQQKQ